MTIKLKPLLVVSLLILTLFGCSAETETPSQTPIPIQTQTLLETPTQTPTPTQSPSPTETKDPNLTEPLVLFFCYYGDNVRLESTTQYLLAQEFMKQNPGKEIEVQGHNFSNPTNTSITGMKRALAKANSGKGPDIMDLYFPFYIYKDFGIEYTDINKLIEQDENFNSDDYFMNVLDSLKVDGKLEYMPMSANPMQISLNRKYEELSDVSFIEDNAIKFSQMLDIYERAAASRGGTKDLYLLDYKVGQMGVVWSYDLFGLTPEERTTFSSTAKGDELLRRWLEIPDMTEELFRKTVNDHAFRNEVEKIFSFMLGYGVDQPFALRLGYNESTFTTPVGLAAENGEVYFNVLERFAINEACENKELAWEFLKFCASNPEITKPGNDYTSLPYLCPLNKEALERTIRDQCQSLYDQNAESGIQPPEGLASIDKAVKRYIAVMELCGQPDEYFNMSNKTPYYFFGAIDDYRINGLPFEQMVEKIENEVRMWNDKLLERKDW